jgi:hypothetical protein
MGMRMLFLAVAFAVAVTGCAHNVHAVLSDPGGGAVLIELTQPTTVVAAVNGHHVADCYTSRVLVEGVPAGTARVDVAAGGWHETRVERHITIEVQPRETTVVAIAGPEQTVASALFTGLYLLGMWICMAALVIAPAAVAL